MAYSVWNKETACSEIGMKSKTRYVRFRPTQSLQLPCFIMAGRLLAFCNRPDVRLYHNLIWSGRPSRTVYSGVVGGKTLE